MSLMLYNFISHFELYAFKFDNDWMQILVILDGKCVGIKQEIKRWPYLVFNIIHQSV